MTCRPIRPGFHRKQYPCGMYGLAEENVLKYCIVHLGTFHLASTKENRLAGKDTISRGGS
jgi:hypothetical protein